MAVISLLHVAPVLSSGSQESSQPTGFVAARADITPYTSSHRETFPRIYLRQVNGPTSTLNKDSVWRSPENNSSVYFTAGRLTLVEAWPPPVFPTPGIGKASQLHSP